MKKLLFLLLAVMLLTACGQAKENDWEAAYMNITAEKAKQIMEKAEDVLTDKDQLILVYCRSGRRSKIAAEALVELGYTNIREFGGIIDWPYEVER